MRELLECFLQLDLTTRACVDYNTRLFFSTSCFRSHLHTCVYGQFCTHIHMYIMYTIRTRHDLNCCHHFAILIPVLWEDVVHDQVYCVHLHTLAHQKHIILSCLCSSIQPWNGFAMTEVTVSDDSVVILIPFLRIEKGIEDKSLWLKTKVLSESFIWSTPNRCKSSLLTYPSQICLMYPLESSFFPANARSENRYSSQSQFFDQST